MTDTLHHCENCGAVLPVNTPSEHCPKCLLQLGLGAGEAETIPMAQPPAGTTDSPKAGDQLGHYRLIRLLGRGGMGAVYEAEDTENGRRLALKILSHSLDSPDARHRFFREGRLAASINHPNSVYVFGTEEIAGTPVIAMELVPGGTLEDRTAMDGPLPVGEAVEAILEAIDGLEAAQQTGILHRDIKPSNCFLDEDGSVKVGDFGLSLSTAVRTDSNLTEEGAYLGTPAFSSPEQLRGDELTVRSDIYAVGVTLYYLLTGKTPFASKHMVQLLATVLEKPAESPAKNRPEIPEDLCAAVLRCLAKNPEDRFKDYAELRAALLPFASTAPTPATVGQRFLAGLLDSAVLFLLLLWMTLMLGNGTITSLTTIPATDVPWWGWALHAAAYLIPILYFAVPEGRWGTSPGKWLCGLRVIRLDRNVPGFTRALGRASLFVLLMSVDEFVSDEAVGPWFPPILLFTFFLLLFCTMRRHNGFAAVHDLLTKTRVVSKPAFEARQAMVVSEAITPEIEAAAKVGPYDVLETLEKTPEGEWLLGFDGRLLRKVWLHVVPAGTAPVEPKLQMLRRPGRLRWLGGRRSGQENWDAFEGITGQPLVNLLDHPQPWKQVRHWLHDLATEIPAAEQDGSLPGVLALDRVWITGDGRAKLLDFRAPGAVASGISEASDAKAFLDLVARSATGSGKSFAPPLPVHAREFLEKLPAFATANAAAEALKPLLHRFTEVTRARRAAMVALGLAFPLFVVALMGAIEILSRQIDPDAAPGYQEGLDQLGEVLFLRDYARRGEPGKMHHYGWRGMEIPSDKLEQLHAVDDRTFEIYIAGRLRSVLMDEEFWKWHAAVNELGAASEFEEQDLALLEKIRQAPAPTPEEHEKAAAALKPFLTDQRRESTALPGRFDALYKPWRTFSISLGIFVAIPAIIAAFASRGGLVMHALGVTVVRADGGPASRGRLLWRSLVSWAPAWLVFWHGAVCAYVVMASAARATSSPGTVHGPGEVAMVLIYVLPVIAIVLVAWSLLLRGRSLQDRIAGTALVAR